MIKRRRIIYVEGYDPQGAEGYYDLFQRSWRRFLKIWPLKATIGPLSIDSDDFAHWTVDAAGPNWQVSTRYDFLRQEQFIRANMAQPMWRQVPRALWWILNYLVTGTIFRVLIAAWRYGLALIYFQLLLLSWLVASGLAGWLLAYAVARFAGGPWLLHAAIGIVAALIVFRLLRPLADRLFTVQINSHWPYLLEYSHGKASGWDRSIEAGARHLVDVARANDANEIVVIGHSGGGVIAPAVVARALELDPDLGRHGPRVILLTPGSLMPGIGLHRGAVKVHAVIERIAAEPSIRWIDVQARSDALNFWDFDPVAGLGIDVGSRRCNPLIWKVRVRKMVLPEFYNKLQWNLFRMHYQFIMANDLRAPYDYFMLVCGPLPVEEWASDKPETVESFAADATYTPAPAMI